MPTAAPTTPQKPRQNTFAPGAPKKRESLTLSEAGYGEYTATLVVPPLKVPLLEVPLLEVPLLEVPPLEVEGTSMFNRRAPTPTNNHDPNGTHTGVNVHKRARNA